MSVLMSLFPIVVAWAPKAKEVPGIFKVILPFLLVVSMLTVAGIAVLAIVDLIKKKVALEDESEKFGKLPAGEMTKYEAQSKIAPGHGKVLAVFFIIGLIAFMFGGMYTMGRGSSTTEQLRKEGKEKSKAKTKSNAQSTSLEVGEDGDEGKSKTPDIGTGLDGMK
ncbi:MAG: hypothetical protein ABI333_07695 [bacterium]